MRRYTAVIAAAVGVAALVSPSAGQQPSAPPQATFRADVDLVQVDVSVLDKNRKPVRGLAAADFTILEDGKPTPVVAFTPVDLPGAGSGAPHATWMRDVAPDVATNALPEEGRVVIVMLDRSIPPGEPTSRARTIARAAIDELGAGDVAAVVYTGMSGIRQSLTADRARLLQAISGTDTSMEISAEAQAIADSLAAGVGMAPGPVNSGQCYCGVCTLESIARIADAVRTIDRRRKSLLFVGSNLVVESSDPDCGWRLRDARIQMLRALDLANLTVHSIDPRGLETLAADAASAGPRPPSAAMSNLVRQGGLAVLPDATGGRTVVNNNTSEKAMSAIFGESESYYLLGFAPAHRDADGAEHKIDVRVGRRGVTVTTRRRYVNAAPSAPTDAPLPDVAPTGTSPASARTIAGVLPQQGIRLAVGASAFAGTSPGDATVAVTIELEEALGAAHAGPAQVIVGAFSPRGDVVGTVRQTVAVDKAADAHGDVQLDIWSKLTLPPGRYEIRAGLDDEGLGRQGSVYTFLDVPAFDTLPLSLSDVVLSTTPARLATPRGLFADDIPVPPTARRDFESTSQVSMFVRVYQGATQPPSETVVSARIRDTSNRVVSEQRSVLAGDAFSTPRRAADYRWRLPLTDLPGGDYLLSVDAQQGRSGAHRDVRFRVKSVAVAAAAAPHEARMTPQDLSRVLLAAATYLDGYYRDVSAVVAEERYDQTAPVQRRIVKRQLRSDFLEVNLGSNAGFVGFRDVFEVDGQPVRDRDERLARLFQLSGANAIGQGRRILDDGTRFNLNGDVGVRRTINMPFTALGFLTSRNQVRSRFQFERYEAAGGLRCVVIRFEEVATPRMLQSDNNAAAHGLVWIDPATGRILRTQLDFATSARLTITATFRVEYAVPPGLSLLLPVSLDERYDFAPGGGVITGHAEYSKFRQFKVDVGTNIK